MSASPLGPRDRNSSRPTDGTLSPFKTPGPRDRSLSRADSRTSLRSHSPSVSLDDPIAVRQQMSSLKHNIRQQQAQLNSLETIVRSGPRPYPAELNDEYSGFPQMSGFNGNGAVPSTPPSSFSMVNGTPSKDGMAAIKMKRRSSYDVLQDLAGPESSLPLPSKREGLDGLMNGSSGIKEGVPMTFSVSTPTHYKRQSSPTRTLSRIPVSAVGNARALQDEGNSPTHRPAHLNPSISTNATDPSLSNTSSGSGSQPLPSPSKRFSLTPGGTTKVLADLQTGVVNARNALENTKAQLRMSQRTVASLTRQTEDLKEARERLRLENEGLNNVVARKERLLQEVLERARKAEAESTTLKTSLKSETSTSKKTIREMESALAESTALSQKSEREYLTLRDSLKHLTEQWKHDTDKLRDEMRKREDKVKNESERVGKMYNKLVEEVKAKEKGKEEVKRLWEEDKKKDEEIRSMWVGEIERLKSLVEGEGKKSAEASRIANHLSEELARLRRLMQTAGRTPSEDDQTITSPPVP
ncbi:hypothetical protein CPB83DRAFT_850699 [Crepidotus variabilis]|uniref:SWI5-dependent HO expression protein 3 n=1 Tax=Crepidotus variabilis TaxID=179855 RepID=A0A9P6EKK6_9AGAR|nr:hypothetical protein CPB83DRAFT_850699 [Crepidotus variabilis]